MWSWREFVRCEHCGERRNEHKPDCPEGEGGA